MKNTLSPQDSLVESPAQVLAGNSAARISPSVSKTQDRKERAAPLPALYSIRFFLALFVFVFHYSYGAFPSLARNEWILSAASNPHSSFFCLSGFILAYQYPRIEGIFSTTKYFIARFARVIPLYWVALLTGVLIGPVAAMCSPQDVIPSFFAQFFAVQAWIPNSSYYYGFNSPGYSLSVEVFLYLCFPLLAGLSIRSLLLILAVSIVVPNFITSQMSNNLQYYVTIFPPAHLCEFIIGMLAAKGFTRHSAFLAKLKNNTAGIRFLSFVEIVSLAAFFLLPLLFFALPAMDAQHESLGMREILPRCLHMTIFATLVVTLAIGQGRVARLLSHPALVALGEYSYAIYLFHLIFILAFYNYKQPLYLYGLPGFIAMVVATLIFSYLAYRFVETPARKTILSAANKYLAKLPAHESSFQSLERALKAGSTPGFALVLAFIGIYSLMWMAVVPTDFSPAANIRSLIRQGKFLPPVPELQKLASIQNVEFGNAARLLYIRSRVRERHLELSCRWQALKEIDLRTKVAVRFLDENGNVLSNLTHTLASPTVMKEGLQWNDHMRIPIDRLHQMESLEIAVRLPSAGLTQVKNDSEIRRVRVKLADLKKSWHYADTL